MALKKTTDYLKRNGFTLIMVGASFLLAILLSFISLRSNMRSLRTSAEEKMRLETNVFLSLSSQHFLAGVEELRSAGGFFAGSEEVTRPEFYRFVEASKFLENYEGFQTFGYAPLVLPQDKDAFITSIASDTSYQAGGYPVFTIYPAGERAQYLPISYIYPEQEVGFLMGLDSYGDAVRTENANRARDLGEVSVSGLVKLGEGGLGVIVAYPVYATVETPQTLQERRSEFRGLLTTVIDAQKFFSLTLGLSNLRAYGVNASITGRTGEVFPINNQPQPQGFFSRFYGSIAYEDTLDLTDTTSFTVAFSAPMISILSFQELFSPFLYVGLAFAAAVIMSIIIIVSQRTKTISELRQRYAFISTLSHQLRTPISKLRWAAESLKVSKAQQDYRAEILGQSKELGSITDSLLTYMELSGALNIHKTRVTAKSFCKELTNAFSAVERKRVVCKIGDVEGLLLGDMHKLVQAVKYVVNNGLTYSPASKKVLVTIVSVDHRMQIRIKDEGFGIPKKDQDNIFQEFFRASNASLGKNSGSGVSLFIVKRIIEDHDGTITFTSEEGMGTEFVIELPLV